MPNLKAIHGLDMLRTGAVTNMNYMFKNCTSLEYVDVAFLDTSNVTEAEGMFENSGIKKLNFSKNDMNKIDNLSYFVSECLYLEEIIFPNTPNVTNMSHMFYRCGVGGGTSAKVDGQLNTISCEDMSYMFADSALEDYSFIGNFNTKNLKTAERMFYTCIIDNIDLSKWDTQNLRNAECMFYDCGYLTTCNLDNWDVNNLKTCESLFAWCPLLETVSLNWKNTQTIQNAAYLFQKCIRLQTLDLSSFDNTEFGDTREMFAQCYDLNTIYSGGFKSLSSTNMFIDCTSIKGKVVYNPEVLDINAASTAYYFTKKG